MKVIIYTFIILIVIGIGLAGCSQPSENIRVKKNPQTTDSSNKKELENAKVEKSTAEAQVTKANDANAKAITVYKSPTCGCCTEWESHMTKAGYKVTSNSTDEMTKIKRQYKVPQAMESCHTAIVDGYIVEGHVPASDVAKLLKTRPDIVGLAAPGMPPKSPGMQPEGKEPLNYDVLSFDKEGKTEVFSSY